jgi:lipopolysaccharide export system permease protein
VNTIWKRHFFVELLKVFVLFIGCFYFLYVLIDYASHTKVLHTDQLAFLDIILYYACQFTKRADILLPIALMVATIKVLTTSNLRNEILALATGGIPLKKIMRPFLWAAFFCAALLYLNFQFLQPLSLSWVASFEERYFKGQGKMRASKQVHALVLEDNTLLIYQTYDQEKRAFFDVFWLKSCDHFCRIQTLLPHEKIPLGKYVDSLMRTSDGEIVKLASYKETSFPDMRFDTKALFSALHPPRMQSISQLAHHLGGKQTRFGTAKMTDREAEAATFFYFKLAAPLICLLAVIGPAPYCLQFSRNLPVFLIYTLSLFGIITLFTFVNSSVILGESQVMPPILAIALPQMLFFFILGWKYAKL